MQVRQRKFLHYRGHTVRKSQIMSQKFQFLKSLKL